MIFEGKKRLGFNTDYRAAMDSLDDAIGGADEVNQWGGTRTALVLGAAAWARPSPTGWSAAA